MSRPFHDLGGSDEGAIDRTEHPPSIEEQRVDAMLMLLSDQRRRLIRVDEHRRTMEQFGEEFYWSLSYYERWLHSITSLMLEKGILTRSELDARIACIRAGSGGPADSGAALEHRS